MAMSRHQPALLGGLFIGVLSALPVVSSANACCCLWVVAGGVLVVYLQQQNTPLPVETADAVLGGLIAGLIGAVIACLGQYIQGHGDQHSHGAGRLGARAGDDVAVVRGVRDARRAPRPGVLPEEAAAADRAGVKAHVERQTSKFDV